MSAIQETTMSAETVLTFFKKESQQKPISVVDFTGIICGSAVTAIQSSNRRLIANKVQLKADNVLLQAANSLFLFCQKKKESGNCSSKSRCATLATCARLVTPPARVLRTPCLGVNHMPHSWRVLRKKISPSWSLGKVSGEHGRFPTVLTELLRQLRKLQETLRKNPQHLRFK